MVVHLVLFLPRCKREKKESENQTDLKNIRAQRNVSGIILLIIQKKFQFKKLEEIQRRFQNIWKVNERKHPAFNLLMFIETFLLVKSNSLKFGYWRTNALSNWLVGWMADWLTAVDWFIHWKSRSKNSKTRFPERVAHKWGQCLLITMISSQPPQLTSATNND